MKRREVYKRDATNYIYSAEDTGRVLQRGSAAREAAEGPRVLGRLSAPAARPTRVLLDWRLRDARLGERTANVTFR